MARRRSLLALVVALLALSGCSSSSPTSQAAPTPTATSAAFEPTLSAPVDLGSEIASPTLKDHRLFYASPTSRTGSRTGSRPPT